MVNYLGNKTRHFNLDVTSVLFNGYIRGYGLDCLRWDIPCLGGSLYPIVGAGVGVSRFTIYNFLSTGLSAEDSELPPFASSNFYTARHEFTYQASVALEYLDQEGWGLTVGYRWFAGDKFRGPSFINTQTGTPQDISGYEWTQKLKANEVFVQLKLYF